MPHESADARESPDVGRDRVGRTPGPRYRGLILLACVAWAIACYALIEAAYFATGERGPQGWADAAFVAGFSASGVVAVIVGVWVFLRKSGH